MSIHSKSVIDCFSCLVCKLVAAVTATYLLFLVCNAIGLFGGSWDQITLCCSWFVMQ